METSTRRTAQLLKYRFRWVAWEPTALITVIDRKRNGHTSFNDTTSGLDVQPRGDEGDIGKIENLSSVRERHCPQFWGWTEDVDITFSTTRYHL